MRKTKVIQLEVSKAAEKLVEVQKLQEEAEQEEKKLVEDVEAKIKAIADGQNLFVGAILTRHDLLAILDIALQTGESVKVPFKIYFNE